MKKIHPRVLVLLRQANPDLHEELSHLAERSGLSISALLSEAVSRFLIDEQQETCRALTDIDKKIQEAKARGREQLKRNMPMLKDDVITDDMTGWQLLVE